MIYCIQIGIFVSGSEIHTEEDFELFIHDYYSSVYVSPPVEKLWAKEQHSDLYISSSLRIGELLLLFYFTGHHIQFYWYNIRIKYYFIFKLITFVH